MRQNIRSWALAAVGGACLMSLPGMGRSQGWYLNAEAGVSLADKVDLDRFIFGPFTSGAQVEFDTGARFGVSGGYNFNPYIGAELETGFIYNSVKNLAGGGDVGLSHIPMMANVVLRYDQPNCNWVPYAGAGVGGDLSVLTFDNYSNGFYRLDGSESAVVFAWQLFAGLRYKINPNMSIGAGYKYYSADSATWDIDSYSDAIKFGKANVHSILVEFNIKF